MGLRILSLLFLSTVEQLWLDRCSGHTFFTRVTDNISRLFLSWERLTVSWCKISRYVQGGKTYVTAVEADNRYVHAWLWGHRVARIELFMSRLCNETEQSRHCPVHGCSSAWDCIIRTIRAIIISHKNARAQASSGRAYENLHHAMYRYNYMYIYRRYWIPRRMYVK
jgi:hypothetical protein